MAYLLDANVFIQAKNLQTVSTFVLLFGIGSLRKTRQGKYSALRRLATRFRVAVINSLTGPLIVGQTFSSSPTRSYCLHYAQSAPGLQGKVMSQPRSTPFSSSQITTLLHTPLPTDRP
jgi:hypothetical protein